MVYTQKDIFDYLLQNPLGVEVHVGSLEDLNGQDYIFFNYLNDNLIGSDDKGVYRTRMQIAIATRDFERNKVLTDYVKNFLNVSVSFDKSFEFEYYLTRCECGVLMHNG